MYQPIRTTGIVKSKLSPQECLETIAPEHLEHFAIHTCRTAAKPQERLPRDAVYQGTRTWMFLRYLDLCRECLLGRNLLCGIACNRGRILIDFLVGLGAWAWRERLLDQIFLTRA